MQMAVTTIETNNINTKNVIGPIGAAASTRTREFLLSLKLKDVRKGNNNGAEMISLKSSLTATSLLLCATSAFAQTAPPSAASGPTTAQTATIEEVVVTAERHETSVQKAPLTIQVIGADQVRRGGLTTVTDIGKLSTGVEIGVGGSSTQIFIRGVGDFSFNPLANPGVAFNVDGIYVGRPDGLGGNLYDVSRVEVLKGPQGTLYGRNANGGSINVITNEPKVGLYGGDLNVEVGNYGLVHTDGALSVPIGDTAAVRAAFNVVRRDGYLSDGTNDDVQESGRLRFKWQPNADITLRLNGDYSHIGGNNGGYVYLPARPGANPWEGVGSPAAIAYRNAMPPLGALLDPTPPNTRQDTKLWNISGQLDWKLPFATLTVVPAYRDADVLSDSYPGFGYQQPNRTHQSSLEARLGDSNPALTWVAGAYVFHENGHGSIQINESDIVQNTLLTYTPTTDAYAAFGQATVRVLDHLRLIGGARYTYERRTLDGQYVDERPAPFGPGAGTVLERYPGTASFDGVTYKVGAEYDLAPQNLLFLTASTGFKAGGLNETVPPEAIYRPEKLISVEAGSKNRFFDNRLQVNFGLYHWTYQQLQDQRVTFDPLNIINLIFFNVGDATIQGATLDLVAKPTAADTITLGAEYADSHYDSFTVKVPTAVYFPGSIGCQTSIVGPNTVANCAGYQVARVPAWTGTVGYEHLFNLPNDGVISLTGGMKFASSRWVATDFIPAEHTRPYQVFDATLTYSPPNRRYSLSAYVRNIGQAAYYTGGFEQPFVPGLFAANIASPRTFGVRASFNFGGG
jgi:iron complex outermembrane receptor protein